MAEQSGDRAGNGQLCEGTGKRHCQRHATHDQDAAVGSGVPGVHVPKPLRQKAIFGQRKDQTRRRDHRAGEVAAYREYGSERYGKGAEGTCQRATDVDESSAPVFVWLDDRHKHQYDEKVEQTCANDRAHQNLRQRAAGLLP